MLAFAPSRDTTRYATVVFPRAVFPRAQAIAGCGSNAKGPASQQAGDHHAIDAIACAGEIGKLIVPSKARTAQSTGQRRLFSATMGCMSASDAAPLPRLGEVFFDVRGNSRSMRLSWYADTGVAVLSIWQGGMCTGTFRLAIADLPRMVETLRRGPAGQGHGGQGHGGQGHGGDATRQAFAAAATQAQAEPADYGAPTAAYPPDPAAYRTEPAAYQADPAAYPQRDPAAYQPQAADYHPGTAAYPHTGATAYAADYQPGAADYQTRAADYQTRAAGYPPERAGYPPSGAADPTDPPGYRASPAGYLPPPAEYQPEYQPERADYRARPAEYQPGPAGYSRDEYQAEPADYRTGSAGNPGYRTSPAEYQPGPAGYADEYQSRGYQRSSLPEQQTYSGSSAPIDYRKAAPAAHYPRDSSSPRYRDAAESTAADYQAHYSTLVTDGSPDASPGESFPYGQPAGNRRAQNWHAAPEAPFD